MIDPLIVDAYSKDFGGKPAVQQLVHAGYPWCGLIMKASEGTYYGDNQSEREWFMSHWLPARELPLERYGAPANQRAVYPFYRGAYHYLRVDQDPIRQADLFLSVVQLAGGWGPGDLWPMVDVESAENPPDASAAQIEDAVGRFASKVTGALGRSVMLYGNIYLAERGVTSHMNCGLLTVPRYTADLPPAIYQRIGWQIAQPPAIPTVWGWQYSGDPDGGSLKGYPTKCPLSTTEDADIIAMIVGGGADPWAALDWTSENLSR